MSASVGSTTTPCSASRAPQRAPKCDRRFRSHPGLISTRTDTSARGSAPTRAKIKRIFSELSLAHDTLVHDEKRAAYDKQLPPSPPPPARTVAPAPLPARTVAPAPLPARTVAPAPLSPTGARSALRRHHPLARTIAPSPISPPSAQAIGARDTGLGTMAPRRLSPSSTDLEWARHQAFAVRLAGQATSRMRPSMLPGAQVLIPPGAPPPSSPPSTRFPTGVPAAARIEGCGGCAPSTLRRIGGAREDQAFVAPSPVGRGRHGQGDFVEAAKILRGALSLDHAPDTAMRSLLVEAETKAKGQERASALEAARDAEQRREFAEAGAQWARAHDLAAISRRTRIERRYVFGARRRMTLAERPSTAKRR